MKRCPECRKDYLDDSLLYCLDDGSALVQGVVGDTPTAIMPSGIASDAATRAQIYSTDETAVLPSGVTGVRESIGFDRRLLIAPLALAVIVLGGFICYRYFSTKDSGAIDSIAVLPFENRSGNADSEYLSDGLADSLIYRLSQLPDLKVSPTSSVMRYKGMASDPARVASELGVDAIMTGRLSQIADNLNISVQLIDVKAGKVIWAEQYDRKTADLLATQREIATEITQRMQLKLSGTDQQRLTKKYTDNDEAYQLYLRAQYHLARRSKDDLEKAIDYYQKAINLDPKFALAYVGMSYAYNTGAGNNFFSFSREEGLSRGRAAAVQAESIDSNLAEAHVALGLAMRSDWKWVEAENEFKKALEIDPKNTNAHYYYGIFLQGLGRTREAIEEIKTAVDLEPLSLIMNANLAGAYMFDRQNELAMDMAKKTYDLDPNFISGRFWLAHTYCANKRYAEAIELVNGAPKDHTTQRLLARFLGYALAKSGRRKEAESLLTTFESDAGFRGYPQAVIYSALGEKDKAFAALGIEFETKGDSSRAKVDPLLDDLRDDTRLAALLKRMNLPQ